MALDQCAACDCIRGSLTPEEFYQRSLLVLCEVLDAVAALSPGGANSTTAVTTSTPVNVASVTVHTSNAAAKGVSLVNNSIANAYVKFGATASTTSYIHKMNPDEEWPAPFNYVGRIDVIWDAADATGTMIVTEFLP